MQLALSFDTCVPLAPQHAFPPAKDELAANTPAANNAKVVLIMHLRQHELSNVQMPHRRPERQSRDPVEVSLKLTRRLPSREDDGGPRLRQWKTRPSLWDLRSLREVPACTRDDRPFQRA